MSSPVDLYARRDPVVWRDTGVHVVAMALGGAGKVVVIGGGGAHLWRLLDRPRTVAELLDELGTNGPVPTPEEVDTTLRALEARSLVWKRGV